MVRYCSRGFQTAHWKASHKAACKTLHSQFEGNTWEPAACTKDAVRDVAEKYREDPCNVPGDQEAFQVASKGFNLLTGKIGFLDGLADGKRIEALPSGPVDRKRAMDLIEKAAEMGNPCAQYQASLFHLEDDDGGEATLVWLKKAAHNSHAEAQMTYGAQYWIEGRVVNAAARDHEKDKELAVIWMRRGLAHGVSEGGHPDPSGKLLSAKSFEKGLQSATTYGRKLYLRAFEHAMMSNDDAMSNGDDMRLAADCGIAPAINIMVSLETNEKESAVEEQELKSDTTADVSNVTPSPAPGTSGINSICQT